MGDIGTPQREVEFEPLIEPVVEPTPAEPIPAPQPV